MRGLDWQTWTMRFIAGLNQKADPRALEPPELSRALDVQFDEIGGVQTRKPFGAPMSAILSAGTISNARRIVPFGTEFLLFTKDTLYSWHAQLSKWVARGTHLAVAVDEAARFVTTEEQITCDRAELNNLVVYAWVGNGRVYSAAIDKTTEAVVVPPTDMSGLDTCNRPRLVALSTRLFLFYNNDTTGFVHYVEIDPDDPVGTLASGNDTSTGQANHNDYYDVTRVIGADQAVLVQRLTPTTSYGIAVVGAGGVSLTTKARVCDGPIAVSCSPTGTHIQIVRSNNTNIQGDLVAIAGFADVFTAQAIGTIATGFTCNQITAAHRSVQDGAEYRCYAFWSSEEASNATDWQSKTNWVDTAGTLGAQATFVRRLGVASRAFDHDGRVFVWMAFAGESTFSGANADDFRAQLQNTYFLYRDDAFLCGRAAFQKAGGFSQATGHLPGVAAVGTNEYAWCGVERRIIQLTAKQSSYAARAPHDVVFTFDSDRARRCARLGSTLYITGAEVLAYDGTRLVEVGYHIYPWYFGAIEVPAGNLADGTYAIQNTYRWENAAGEVDRSTTATTGTVTIAAGPNGISIPSWVPLYVTHKTGIAVEVWRSEVNPQPDSPFFLSTAKDPTDTTNPNRFIANDTTLATLPTFNDELADSSLKDNESSPENGVTLENLAPPPASIILASETRLFLAGIAGDPDRVWYSKQRNTGEVAAFHEALTTTVPPAGGDITGLAFLNETLVVFRESAVYMLPGDGFDNNLGGANYGPARTISVDVGAVAHDSIAVTDRGVIFKSSKGWYLLDRGWALQYIGGPVVDYDSETPLAIDVVESQHQVRILTSARMLVFDTLASQLLERPIWSEWTIADGVHAAIWNGTHHYLTSSGPKAEQSTYSGLTYGLDVETAWVKFADLQGFARVRWFQTLGEYRSPCKVRIRVAINYDDAYIDDVTWAPAAAAFGGPLEVEHSPTEQQVKAIKVRLTAVDVVNTMNPPSGEAFRLTGLAFFFGFKPGLYRRLPAEAKA